MAHTSRQYAARKDATGQSKPSISRSRSTGSSEHRTDAELLADAGRSAAAARTRLGLVGETAAERQERRRDAQEVRENQRIAADKARLAEIARLDEQRAELHRHLVDHSQAMNAQGRALRTRDGEIDATQALARKIAEANRIYDAREADRQARHRAKKHTGPAPR